MRHVLDIDENIEKNKFQVFDQNDSSDPFIFTYDFFLENCNKDMFERRIGELNGWLGKLGANFQLRKDKDGYNTLSVDINVGRVKQVTEHHTRNAGRKKLELDKSWDVVEIEKKIAKTNAETVAKELGISRATLFRRLKEIKETQETESADK